MKKLLCSANLLVILVLVLAGIFISGADSPRERRQTPSYGRNQVYDSNNLPATIAIEAYLAQIPDEALIEIGLPLIPTKESETITVDKLLNCLNSTKVKGKIISYGRWVTVDNVQCVIEQKNFVYFPIKVATCPNDTSIAKMDYQKYDIGTSGSVTPFFTENNKISVGVNFNYYDLLGNNKDNSNNEIPHDNSKYHLDETCLLNNDVPAIVGAMKQGDSVLYLVVRAKVLDE